MSSCEPSGVTPADGQPGGGPEVLHYLHDTLGSVVALTDSTGAVVERYTYEPYGETLIEETDPGTGVPSARLSASRFGNPFCWTGQRYDASVRLYHFLFRGYSPHLGRWMQRDPLPYLDGINLYRYALSAPINFLDPLGLYPGRGLIRKVREALGGVVSVGPGPAYDAGAGDSYKKSIEYSNKYADKGSDDDPDGARNAARHANWQARLTYKHGEDAAEKIGDIHEAGNADDPDTQADKHNNKVGREIGKKAKEEGRPIDDIDELVDEAMKDGRLIRDRVNDPRIKNPTGKSTNSRSDSPCSPEDSSPESNDSESPSDKPIS